MALLTVRSTVKAILEDKVDAIKNVFNDDLGFNNF